MKLQPLALFPLPSHILPGGKLPLRLFEPRHLQMLKESFINDQGFGIVMEESTTSGQSGRILPVGTRVKVTDFYTLNDGLLGVTVDRESGKFVAQISYNHRHIHLGRFDSADLAHAAYLGAKRAIHKACTL